MTAHSGPRSFAAAGLIIALISMMGAPASAVEPRRDSDDVSVGVVIPGGVDPSPSPGPGGGTGGGTGGGNGGGTGGGPPTPPATDPDGSPVSPPEPTEDADTLTLTPTSIEPRGLMTAVGTGYTAGENVEFVLYSEPIVVGNFVADAAGRVTAQFRIPETLRPGTHTAEATGWKSRHVANAPFTVISAPYTGGGGGIPSGWWPGIILVIVCIVLTIVTILLRTPILSWFGGIRSSGSPL